MRCCAFLLLAIVALATRPATAQTSAPTGSATALPGVATVPTTVRPTAVPDTALALHRLFAAKRRRYALVTGGTVAASAAVIIGASASGSANSDQGGMYGPAPGALAVLATFAVGVPALIAEAITLGGWGIDKEERIVAAWQQHHLPKKYYHHLSAKHGKYFR